MNSKAFFVLAFATATSPIIYGQSRPATKMTLPAMAAIRPSELKSDLYELTADHFRGREAGTKDELTAAAWLADKARLAGLEPAGDNGTYFQFFSLKRNRISLSSTIKIGDSTFSLWKDILVGQTATSVVSAPIFFPEISSTGNIDTTQVKGKAVVIVANQSGVDLNISLHERRYPSFILKKYGPSLINNGAAAIIFVTDSLAEQSWSEVEPQWSRGLYDIEGGINEQAPVKPPVFWVHGSTLNFLKKPGLIINSTINVDRFEYPSVNVVAKVTGTDPVLSKEYVLYSGHHDHDGVRQPYGNDSIYNGADDNASVCVAMLAIGRAVKAKPAKRSFLFVWHGAEERGLLGSKWFVSHPTVPKNSIVAVLNGDMIGRNNPDSAALLGVQPPHRNSLDLVQMALDANKEGFAFKLDTLWDKAEHPEVWYFRSDHLPYARAGIPAIFFSSLLHPDYHTPMDEAKGIDMRKLTRMTMWMYRTGIKVSNAVARPGTDPAFKLER